MSTLGLLFSLVTWILVLATYSAKQADAYIPDNCPEVPTNTTSVENIYIGTCELAIKQKSGRRRRKRDSYPVKWSDRTHSWILYKDCYFEFGVSTPEGGHEIRWGTDTAKSDKCPPSHETVPAGSSSIPLGCVKQCARNYKEQYGNYGLINNNCHKFVNRMFEALTGSSCPSWCGYKEASLQNLEPSDVPLFQDSTPALDNSLQLTNAAGNTKNGSGLEAIHVVLMAIAAGSLVAVVLGV